MTALLDCPAEVLHLTFEHLPASSLRALCLVNKRLHQIAEPLLYTGIELVWLEHRPPPIISLLRTLRERPRLANRVKQLTLHAPFSMLVADRIVYSGGLPITYLPPDVPTKGADLTGLIATIQDSNPPFRDRWIRELKSGKMDAFVMLLLSFARYITRLKLTGDFARANRLLGIMLRASLCQDLSCRLPKLQLLQDVIVEPGVSFGRNQDRNTVDMLPLFYLPSVRSIAVEIDNPTIFAWPTYTPSPSHITTLHLKIVREGHLGRILATTKCLKVLKWRWEYQDTPRDEINTNVVNLDQITADLAHVGETLECLCITAKCHLYTMNVCIHGALTGLRKFKRLQTLKIPQFFLDGFEGLMPKKIYHLTINDNMEYLGKSDCQDHDVLDKLQRWWEGNMHHTPCFHSFKLRTRFSESRWSAGIRKELSDLGTRVGIQLEISDPEWFWD